MEDFLESAKAQALREIHIATMPVRFAIDSAEKLAEASRGFALKEIGTLSQTGPDFATGLDIPVTQVSIRLIKYGDREITDKHIRYRIQEDIQLGGGNFLVKNENLGGDPQPGHTKKLVVEYRDTPDAPFLMLSAAEGHRLPTAYRVNFASYDGTYLTGYPEVMAKLERALNEGVTFTVDNATMGFDPAPGKKKTLYVKFVHAVEQPMNPWRWMWRAVEFEEGLVFPPPGFDVQQLFKVKNIQWVWTKKD